MHPAPSVIIFKALSGLGFGVPVPNMNNFVEALAVDISNNSNRILIFISQK